MEAAKYPSAEIIREGPPVEIGVVGDPNRKAGSCKVER